MRPHDEENLSNWNRLKQKNTILRKISAEDFALRAHFWKTVIQARSFVASGQNPPHGY